jgi:hypothetical protein
MTTNQKQIIDALVNEFNRIEAMHKPSTTFSLINVDALNDKTNEIKRYKMQEEAESLAWDEIANEEARRLVKLFQEDLPTASVQKYGKENRFYDLPSVLIRRDERSSTHHEDCVNVEVVVVRRNDVKDSFGNYYNRCVKLNYRYNYLGKAYETIEELVSEPHFLELIRNRVL